MLQNDFVRRALRGAVAATAWLSIALSVPAAPAAAQASQPVSERIAELERSLARQPSAGKADPKQELQQLLLTAQLATLYAQVGRLDEALSLQERVLTRFSAMLGPDSPHIVPQLEAVASAYGLAGRYAEAERLRMRAIAINERAHGPDSLQVATSLQGIAQLLRLQDRHDDALVFATRALAIAERSPPGDVHQRAIFLSQVGDIHMSARRYEAALPYLTRALSIVDRSSGDTSVTNLLRIQYLQSLSLIHLHLGRAAEGQSYIDRAIAISTESYGPDHAVTALMLTTMATQLADQDRLDEAERLFRRALSMAERNQGLRILLADAHTGFGLIAFKRKDWRMAHAMLGRATELTAERDRMATAGVAALSDRRARPRSDMLLLHAVAAYRIAETQGSDAADMRDIAFRLAQQAERSAAGGALAQSAARSGPLGRLVRERQDLAQEWQQLDRTLEQSLVTPAAQRVAATEEAMRQRMGAITARLALLDAEIARGDPAYAKLADPPPLSIAEVQRLLRAGEVMIFIAERPGQSLVWAIGRETVDWRLVPIGSDDIGREVGALRCGLDATAWQRDTGRACRDATGSALHDQGMLPFDLGRAHALYTALLGPFAQATRNASLLVVANGALSSLPLHVLVTEAPAAAMPTDARGYGDAAWLAARNPMSQLPSVASLAALRAATPASLASEPFLGIANPLLDGPDARFAAAAQTARALTSCAAAAVNAAGVARAAAKAPQTSAAAKAGPALVAAIRAQVPLPETAAEVCDVARALGAGEAGVRLAGRASEGEVKRLSASGALSRYRILHFATHGVLAGQLGTTREPGLVLTPPATASAGDDGYLSASEIAALKLDADWVILSACNTAGGAGQGQAAEALSGLARAFFYAGARSVLASHWEVDSAAAVTLVTGALRELAREPALGRAEVVRRAMLAVMADRSRPAGWPPAPHPSVWAPFVVVGEGR